MELWASGFDAWGQLAFEEPETAPRDLQDFKCVLRDEAIEIIRTTLSATLGRSCFPSYFVHIPDYSCLPMLEVIVVIDHVTDNLFYTFTFSRQNMLMFALILALLSSSLLLLMLLSRLIISSKNL
jgi:hypothetical protein